MKIPRCWLALAAALALCLPAYAGEKPAPRTGDRKGVAVPYKLTDSLHVMVRVKINGKGPLNFIVDTGAPIVFVSKEAAKKVGLEADKRGFAVIDRLDVEGGVVAKKTKARVETVYQLEGMNAMGLAGVELHGILGYNFLAHYKMEIDFTKSKMTWTALEFEPPPLVPIKGKGPAGMEALGGMLKLLSAFMGKTLPGPPSPRGFLGVELADSDGDYVLVKAVLAGGPAAKAGVKAGDHITNFQGKSVSSLTSLRRMSAKLTAAQPVRLTVERDGKKQEISFPGGGWTVKRWITLLAVFALLGPARADEKNRTKPVTVPFELLKSRHMAIQVKINGKGPYRVVFDTGAPVTLLNNKVAKASGVMGKNFRPPLFAPFGSMGEFKIRELDVGGVKAKDVPTMVMDHPTVSAMSNVLGPLEGIVGLSFFGRYRVTIDYQKRELTLVPNDFRPPDLMKKMTAMLMDPNRGKTQIVAPAGVWGFRADKASGDEDAGVTVKEVYAGGPAAKAGLKAGDRVLTLDDRWTDTVADLFTAAGAVRPGTAAQLRVRRGDEELTLVVRPKEGL